MNDPSESRSGADDRCVCSRRYSAFRLAYAFIFLATISVVAVSATNVVGPWVLELAERNFQASSAPKYAVSLHVTVWSLVIVFILHLGRVYFSLELLDNDHGYFKTFLEGLGTPSRVVELFIRIIVICIVSLKAAAFLPEPLGTWLDFAKMESIEGFIFYWLSLYGALVLWDGFMLLCHRRKGIMKEQEWQAFVVPDFLGLVIGIILLKTFVWEANVLWVPLVSGVGGLFIVVSLIWDMKLNRKKYWRHLKQNMLWLLSTSTCPRHSPNRSGQG